MTKRDGGRDALRGRSLVREAGRDLLTLGPGPSNVATAARAGLTMLVALLLLERAGAVQDAAYATFGAFAAVYGVGARPGRWRSQSALGALLVAAVGSGAAVATSDHRAGAAVLLAAGWAAVAAALSDRFSWRPPGPLFFVFAAATCASIPTTGAGAVRALLVAAGTALLAVVLGVVETRWRSGKGLARTTLAPDVRGRPRVQAVRCAVAVLVAGGVATWGGLSHPSWAMVASVVPLGAAALSAQVLRGTHRAIGTVVGLVVAAVLLSLPLSTIAVLVLVLVAALQAATEMVVTRNYALALIFITPLALLIGQVASPQPVPGLLLSRLTETILGWRSEWGSPC